MSKNEDNTMRTTPYLYTEDLEFTNLNGDPLFCDTNALQYITLPNDLFTNEDTMEAHLKFNPQAEFIPTSPRGPPERKTFAGECNFVVEIDGSFTQKKKYLYSHRLNRIYVDMGSCFSVNFNWDASKVNGQPLYVRATPVFSDLAQAEKRVERCYQHSHESSNTASSYPVVVKNVLRSARELGVPDVYYCGNVDYPDSWYSVLVRFPGPTGHAYQFVCKNSCSSGINRRPIDIIFTLEDCTGRVLGRQSVGARACSCPGRDMRRDEGEARGEISRKRPITNTTPAPAQDTANTNSASKKIKLEVVDNDEAVITLPPIQVVGARATITSLRVLLSMMEQLKATKPNNRNQQQLNKSITDLRNFLENLERTYRSAQ